MNRLVVIVAGGLGKMGADHSTYQTYAEYLLELARLVGGVRIYAPIFGPTHPEYEYFTQRRLDANLCEVVPLDGHGRGVGGARLLTNYARQARVFDRDVRQWKRVLVYSPSVTAALAARSLRRSASACQIFTYVWGDWAEMAKQLPQHGVVRKALDPWQRRWLCAQERWLVSRSSATWVAGPRLMEQYSSVGRNVAETIPMIRITELLQRPRSEATRNADTLLYVGRIFPGKGIEVLFEAIALLATTMPRLKLRLVGSGDPAFVASLGARSTALGIGDRVLYVGVLPNGPNLWKEYDTAGALVLPSFSEGFPRVVYEAMALRTPVIASAVGSIPAVLESGRHAILVPPGDAHALAAAIARLLAMDDHGEGFAREGRCLFERRLTVQNGSTAQQVAKVILQSERSA